MKRPTVRELALEADAWRELAEARDDYYRRGATERAHRRLLAAFDALRALEVCAFTPSAMERAGFTEPYLSIPKEEP
jgi:hypothetical protein